MSLQLFIPHEQSMYRDTQYKCFLFKVPTHSLVQVISFKNKKLASATMKAMNIQPHNNLMK